MPFFQRTCACCHEPLRRNDVQPSQMVTNAGNRSPSETAVGTSSSSFTSSFPSSSISTSSCSSTCTNTSPFSDSLQRSSGSKTKFQHFRDHLGLNWKRRQLDWRAKRERHAIRQKIARDGETEITAEYLESTLNHGWSEKSLKIGPSWCQHCKRNSDTSDDTRINHSWTHQGKPQNGFLDACQQQAN